jgi:plasmid stabilization system protein ParE
MSFRVVHDSEASLEFQEAVAWYEAQAAGLGVRFILAVDELMAAIASQPFRFSKAGRRTRKAKMPPPWPYSIFFAINEPFSEIKIIAVWHGARNPSELRARLK